jgi:uncharacterized protein (TIGR02271 family)
LEERVQVPKRHEEVHVERIPVDEGWEAPEAYISKDEVSMLVTEGENMVDKCTVVKNEIRARKDAARNEGTGVRRRSTSTTRRELAAAGSEGHGQKQRGRHI